MTTLVYRLRGEAERSRGRVSRGARAARCGWPAHADRQRASRSQQRGAGLDPYLGTIPDFGGKPGVGVLIQGVRKGSPAEIAGLRAGDRLKVEFDGVAIANLEEYAALLFTARARDGAS